MLKSPALRHCTNRRHAQCRIVIPLLFTVLLLGGCCSSRGIHPHSRSITGQVVDPQDQVVAGVEVRLGDRRVAVTDKNGKFAIRAVPTNDRLAVSFSAPKFMSTTRVYEPRAVPDGNTVIIWPRAKPARLRASEGGKLEFSGGTIVFPPNAFVDTKGRQVKGDVNVSMSVLDIADPRQLASAPGDFTARMRDGSIRSLETFGLFELVVTDERGRPLNFSRDRTAAVEMNTPENGREVPQSVGSFSFDERSGRWSEQSSFRAIGPSRIATQVSQWGWWNADQVYATTCLQVKVLGCRGCEADSVGIPGVTVTATGKNYNGEVTTGTTDGNGFVCLPVKKAALVRLDVSQGSLHGNPLVVATPPGVVDPVICPSCPPGTPLVTATHLSAASFTAVPLTPHDPLVWCASDYWNGSTTEFENTWLYDEIPPPTTPHVKFPSAGLTLTLDKQDELGNPCVPTPGTNCKGAKYASGEYKTQCFHGYGTYTVTIQPIPGSSTNANQGIVTGFFTYTIDGIHDGTIGENNPTSSWDEVDVEILGRQPNIAKDCDTSSPCDPKNANDPNTHLCQTSDLVVQTNYIGKGVGFGVNEQVFCLPYGTHTYSFTWTASSITWSYVDSTGPSHHLRTETRGSNPNWPTQPGRVFMNLWANNTGDTWVGPFVYTVPVSAVFSNVSVP